ncbi:MAG: hypothetical protein KAV00_16615 [Phycisphaerae bacterium]|nr:hypothetical protein [Phycisphaerae bacterium]
MKIARVIGLICVMAFLVATAAEPKPVKEQVKDTVSIPEIGELTLAGPFTHKNLAVYILYRTVKPGDEPAYITLEEGTKAGTVKITEMKQEQVGQLVVSNNSDKQLFLHVGELVKGGKQDRMLQTSLVIPPKSPKAPIPSFCVERSRWSGGNKFTPACIIAPSNDMRENNLIRNQSGVWESVGRYKKKARKTMVGNPRPIPRNSQTSSVNEELEHKAFKKLMEGYQSAMAKATKDLPCPLGLAYAVNGEICTVDVYHAKGLFEKLLPKLLKSCAAAAAVELPKDKEKKIKHPTTKDVANFIKAAWDGKKKAEKLAFGNVFVRLSNKKTLTSQLFYKDALIHVEVIKRTFPMLLRQRDHRPQIAPSAQPRSNLRQRQPSR